MAERLMVMEKKQQVSKSLFVCFFFKVFCAGGAIRLVSTRKKVLKPSILDLHEKLKSDTGK